VINVINYVQRIRKDRAGCGLFSRLLSQNSLRDNEENHEIYQTGWFVAKPIARSLENKSQEHNNYVELFGTAVDPMTIVLKR
jgi:hypothetical protein